MLSKDILQGLNFIEVFSSLDLLLQLLISFSLDLIKKFFNKFPPRAPRKKVEIFGENCFSIVFPSQSKGWKFIEHNLFAAYDAIIFDVRMSTSVVCKRHILRRLLNERERVSVKLLNQGMIVHVHFERDEI